MVMVVIVIILAFDNKFITTIAVSFLCLFDNGTTELLERIITGSITTNATAVTFTGCCITIIATVTIF